ncbi:MAG: hypothetical protein EPN93_18150 [Spirochaetes bacterium]|nr:MAG: hypothetical protein EPN93_18150 [Spirochaetota bacterium]
MKSLLLNKATIALSGLLSLVSLLSFLFFGWLLLGHLGLPYNSEGRYFDVNEGVVYHQESIVGLTVVCLASLIVTVSLAFVCSRVTGRLLLGRNNIRLRKGHRWNTERFLQAACDQMVKELDWDSIDSGCLHHTVSKAKTIDGRQIIVGVITEMNMWEELIEHIRDERAHCNFPRETPVWLYVPQDLSIPDLMAGTMKIRRI